MAITSTHRAFLALSLVHAHFRASHTLALAIPSSHLLEEETIADVLPLVVRRSSLFDSSIVGTVKPISESTKILIGTMLGIFIFGGIVCAIALYFYWDDLVPCTSKQRRAQRAAAVPPEIVQAAADDASTRAVHKINPRTGRPRPPGRARTRADYLPKEIRRSGTRQDGDTTIQEAVLQHHTQVTAKIAAWRERAHPAQSLA